MSTYIEFVKMQLASYILLVLKERFPQKDVYITLDGVVRVDCQIQGYLQYSFVENQMKVEFIPIVNIEKSADLRAQ